MRKPKPKKRDRKPEVKVGPYKKRAITEKQVKARLLTLDKYADVFKHTDNMKIGDTLKIKLPNDPFIPKYSPAPVLTLCGQLEDSVMLLENRISNVIAKINSLM